MNFFTYKNNELYCEELAVKKIANEIGTPVYIYSRRTLEKHYRTFDESFSSIPHIICYSIKANSNIGIIQVFAQLGSGADVVSGGELFRALSGGIKADKIVFSGVGKTEEEIREALNARILMFNVESEEELIILNEIAGKLRKKPNVSLRVNPDVEVNSHKYITTGTNINKFGIEIDKATRIYKNAQGYKNLNFLGIDAHIGSQITMLSPFISTLKKLLKLIRDIEGPNVRIKYLDIGGGLGITYDEESPPHPLEYARVLTKELRDWKGTLITEPGRVIVGNAGILVTRVLYRKEISSKKFVIVDAGMNDLIRPVLYGAFQEIIPVEKKNKSITADIVGPICESSDFLAKDRQVADVNRGDLLAVMSAGAYGFSMSSNYNSRKRPAEVLVEGRRYYIIRKRESYKDLLRGEKLLGNKREK